MMVHRRSFTLIELVVVIAIITLLVALTMYAASSITQRSEISRTEATLKLLAAALEEWERTSERQISFGPNDTPAGAVYDIDENIMVDPDGSGPFRFEDDVTRKILGIIERPESVKQILAQIEPKFVQREDVDTSSDTGPLPASGRWMYVRDAWDKPIRAIHPGRKYDLEGIGPKDADGTVRVPPTNPAAANNSFENAHGIARNRQIYFVSAGPDGRFGDLSAAEGTTDRESARDNIYSVEPILP